MEHPRGSSWRIPLMPGGMLAGGMVPGMVLSSHSLCLPIASHSISIQFDQIERVKSGFVRAGFGFVQCLLLLLPLVQSGESLRHGVCVEFKWLSGAQQPVQLG